jgi:hypothetical protein
VLNLYRKCETNVGDKVSSPLDYFPIEGQKADVWGITKDQLINKNIILGGGGLSIFAESIETLEPFAENIIVWGMGANQAIIKPTPIYLPSFLSRCPLVGVRDWGTSFDWVPCSSCMSPAFDKSYKITNEVGFYEHYDIKMKDAGLPNFKNNGDFEETISFLGSCETIVTNSYHGAYWGVLLNRKVLVWPVNTKLLNFKHQPRVILNNNFQQNLKHGVAYPGALDECREANQRFYEKVKLYLAK